MPSVHYQTTELPGKSSSRPKTSGVIGSWGEISTIPNIVAATASILLPHKLSTIFAHREKNVHDKFFGIWIYFNGTDERQLKQFYKCGYWLNVVASLQA